MKVANFTTERAELSVYVGKTLTLISYFMKGSFFSQVCDYLKVYHIDLQYTLQMSIYT